MISTLHPLISRESASLDSRISDLQKQIAKLPDGHLLILKNGKYRRFAHFHNGIRTYISKNDQQFIKLLLKKKYLSALLKDSIQEQQALQSYLDYYQNYSSNVSQILDDPVLHDILSNYLPSPSNELEEWV